MRCRNKTDYAWLTILRRANGKFASMWHRPRRNHAARRMNAIGRKSPVRYIVREGRRLNVPWWIVYRIDGMFAQFSSDKLATDMAAGLNDRVLLDADFTWYPDPRPID